MSSPPWPSATVSANSAWQTSSSGCGHPASRAASAISRLFFSTSSAAACGEVARQQLRGLAARDRAGHRAGVEHSRNRSRSSPSRSAKCTASVSPVTMVIRKRLTASFISRPCGTGPQSTVCRHIGASSGRRRRRGRVAGQHRDQLAGLGRPAGAGDRRLDVAPAGGADVGAQARDHSGDVVPMCDDGAVARPSRRTSGCRAAAPRRWRPRSASISRTTSARREHLAGLVGHLGAGGRQRLGPAAVRFHTTSGVPARARLRAIGPPMMPRPRNPTTIVRLLRPPCYDSCHGARSAAP